MLCLLVHEMHPEHYGEDIKQIVLEEDGSRYKCFICFPGHKGKT